MSEYRKIENAKGEIIVEVDNEKWLNAQEQSFNKLAKNVQIKGFRKGQAPRNLIKKHLSSIEILLNACESIAQDILIDAIEEHKLSLIDRPELKIDEINENKCILHFICPIKPDVILENYKGLGYKVDKQEATEEEIEKEINNILERKADLVLKEDGQVENGDVVIIDYEGFKDGVAFEGGKAENYNLTIGSNTFIPGFEEQLIGMKSEEEKDIKVRFPDDYHAEDLKGQEVIFKIKVHEIKNKVLPTLNDELVKDLKIENVDNVESLKEYYKNNIIERKTNIAENEATNALLDKLSNLATIDIPEVMIDKEADYLVDDYDRNLRMQGISLEQMLNYTKQTKEEFKLSQMENAKNKVKMNLILEEIAKRENINPTDEDIENEYQKYADAYNMKIDEIKPMINIELIKNDLILSKALEFVKNN